MFHFGSMLLFGSSTTLNVFDDVVEISAAADVELVARIDVTRRRPLLRTVET